MNESKPVPEEGTFKMKANKPKQFTQGSNEIPTINLKEPLIDLPSNVTKIVIPKEDAVSEQSTGSLDEDKRTEDTQEVVEGISEPGLKEITREEEEEEKKVSTLEIVKEVEAAEVAQELPEGVTKLLAFMKETGGDIQDYAKLNTNYDDLDRDTLVKEYYKKTKSHLDPEEIDYLIEDNFSFDDELDEERDIRRKKLAYKEEVAKAKKFLEDTKSKYYDDIKLKSHVTPDQQKATDFFNRHNEDQTKHDVSRKNFTDDTKKYFANDFKGFDFNVGEKKFRYGVSNAESVSNNQSDINNFIGSFLGDDGKITDPAAYHKALYAGTNADKMASHFYEQGKADGIKGIVNASNNPSTGNRKAAPIDGVMLGGYKIKSISGSDSTKLKIKKFKN